MLFPSFCSNKSVDYVAETQSFSLLASLLVTIFSSLGLLPYTEMLYLFLDLYRQRCHNDTTNT